MNFNSLLILKYSLSQEKEIVYRKSFEAVLSSLVLSGKFLIPQEDTVGNLGAKLITSCLIYC
jgi:hypothetical protein